MRRLVRILAPAALIALLVAKSASGAPIVLPGVVINPSADPLSDFAKLQAVLGGSGGSFVAFDLSTLTFDPTAVLLTDDGVPAGPDASGLSGTGLDVDFAGGFASGGGPLSYATSVFGYTPGQRISGTGAGTAELLDAFVATLPAAQKTVAASGGTGGDGFLMGVGSDALGTPDGFLGGTPLTASGFLSIGSAGQLSLLFAAGIDRNGNIGGTIYDFVYFDMGSAGDSGFVTFDDQPIPTVPEPGTWLLLATGGALLVHRARRRRA